MVAVATGPLLLQSIKIYSFSNIMLVIKVTAHLFISFQVSPALARALVPYPWKLTLNPLPDMSILGFSNSAANKDMISKIWTNGDTII